MTRPLALLVLAAAVVFGVGVGSISAASQQSPKAVKGELIVGFADGVSQPEQNAILKDAGATSKKRFGQIDAVLVKVKDDEEAFAVKVFASDPRVAYAQPNHVVSIAATPNDPSFGQLWGLHNTGQTGGTNDKDIDAPEAWELATGDSNIVVAVTDTGVDFSHPDLADQRWVNTLDPVGGGDDDGNGLVDDWSGWDFVNDDNDPFDDHRHGTHVSGTIGAEGDNGVGVVGVNWNVKIMALKFLNSAGSGTTADAIASTLYAADHGADVSSNSWGGGPYEQALLDAIEYGASRGMLFVAAAGNDGFNNDVTPTYPATYASDAVLAVAATDHNDGLAFFSSYGAKIRRSRSSGRGHPLDDAGQHLRVLRRDLDGDAARRGSGRSRRGQVPRRDALRDQGAAHELGGSRRGAGREDGDGRAAQHRQRARLRQRGEGRAERTRQRIRRGRDRRHPDQGPGRQLRRSGRARQRHGHRQRDAGGSVRGDPGHRPVHGQLHGQRSGRSDGYGDW